MVNALRNKKDVEGLTALDINVGVLEIIDAAKESVKTGRAIPLPLEEVKDSFLVAAGILLSRMMGLVRQRVFSHYFGLTDEADAFTAALRIPNFLQNLFGEGVLSASFIPVYASLLATR